MQAAFNLCVPAYHEGPVRYLKKPMEVMDRKPVYGVGTMGMGKGRFLGEKVSLRETSGLPLKPPKASIAEEEISSQVR